MKKRIVRIIMFLLICFLLPFFSFSAGVQKYENKDKISILNKEKLFSNINYIETFKKDFDLDSQNIAFLIKNQEKEKFSQKNKFLIQVISEISPKTKVNIYYFNNEDDYKTILNKINTEKNKGIFHFYDQVDKNDEKNEEALKFLEKFSDINYIGNFFPAIYKENNIFLDSFNSILVGNIGTRLKGNIVDFNSLKKENQYENKKTKNGKISASIVATTAWISNTEEGSMEDAYLATAIIIATFSRMIIEDTRKNLKEKTLLAINSLLSSAKNNLNFNEKYFNNFWLKIGSGVFDFEKSIKNYQRSKLIKIENTSKENEIAYLQEFSFLKEQDLNLTIFWYDQEGVRDKEKYQKYLELKMSQVAASWQPNPVFGDITSEYLRKEYKKTFYSKNDLDLFLDFYDGGWIEIGSSTSKKANVEKISLKIPYSGKYRIRVKKPKEKIKENSKFVLNY
ncbi:hypothetical protein ACXX84_00690 [Mycoplasma sp. AC157]|uniref:hypothetical protein n=1 Tax=Mycoplasma sp. 480 TaxID=3440155 RepID=UPI003F5198AB